MENLYRDTGNKKQFIKNRDDLASAIGGKVNLEKYDTGKYITHLNQGDSFLKIFKWNINNKYVRFFWIVWNYFFFGFTRISSGKFIYSYIAQKLSF